MDNEKLKLEVYINGVPDLRLMPKEIADAFFYALAEEISDWIAKKQNEANSDESK